MKKESPINDTTSAPRVLQLLVGIVSAFIGISLLYLVGWVLIVSLMRPDGGSEKIFWILISIMFVVGNFFVLVSFRLVFNRRAKDGGGLLSPTGWKVLGFIFAGSAIIFFVGSIWEGQWSLLSAAIPSAVFAQMCFQTANKYSKNIL